MSSTVPTPSQKGRVGGVEHWTLSVDADVEHQDRRKNEVHVSGSGFTMRGGGNACGIAVGGSWVPVWLG